MLCRYTLINLDAVNVLTTHVVQSMAVIKISVTIVTDLPVRWHLSKNTPLARETCAFVHIYSVLALSTAALRSVSVKE